MRDNGQDKRGAGVQARTAEQQCSNPRVDFLATQAWVARRRRVEGVLGDNPNVADKGLVLRTKDRPSRSNKRCSDLAYVCVRGCYYPDDAPPQGGRHWEFITWRAAVRFTPRRPCEEVG